MDSFVMYKDLKDKHSRQEAYLKESVTEKLTSVDIGEDSRFDVRNDVRVDGNAVSAKTAFMNVYSQEYVDRLSATDANYITQNENMIDVIRLEYRTQKNAQNLEDVRKYSINNTERDEKTRNNHRKKVNKYANRIILNSRRHRNACSNYVSLNNKEVLTRNEKKTLKKEFMNKYKLDLEVIEDEYQMNKNLLMMGGKKDISEEDSLFRLRYTRYAKAMAANNKGIEMARRYPDIFDETYFQKQLDMLTEKIRKIGETASPALLESKKSYFLSSNVRRTDRIAEKNEAERRRTKGAEIKAKRGERIQGAIDAYIANKAQSASNEEVLWIKENLNLDVVTQALAGGQVCDFILRDNNQAGFGAEFFENFDKAMELFIERVLFAKATEISAEDKKDLLRGGVNKGNIERSVLTQIRPVRRLKNGAFVAAEDEQNYNFNRKYIDAMKTNNMEARRECIEDNFRKIYSYNFNLEMLEDEAFYDTDRWNKFMLSRINLGVSNLLNDAYAAGSSIRDNREIAREIQDRLVHGTVNVEGMDWDYSYFISNLLAFYGMLASHKYNVSPGNMELSTDVLGSVPGMKESLLNELQTFIRGYRELNNNAAA